jgi:hypothetical protein
MTQRNIGEESENGEIMAKMAGENGNLAAAISVKSSAKESLIGKSGSMRRSMAAARIIKNGVALARGGGEAKAVMKRNEK